MTYLGSPKCAWLSILAAAVTWTYTLLKYLGYLRPRNRILSDYYSVIVFSLYLLCISLQNFII